MIEGEIIVSERTKKMGNWKVGLMNFNRKLLTLINFHELCLYLYLLYLQSGQSEFVEHSF